MPSLLVGKKPAKTSPIPSVVPEIFVRAAGPARLIPAFLMPEPGHRQTRFPGEQIILNF